jgi:hypothetical protein
LTATGSDLATRRSNLKLTPETPEEDSSECRILRLKSRQVQASSLLIGRASTPTGPRTLPAPQDDKAAAEPLGRYNGHSRQFAALAVDSRAMHLPASE